MGWERVSADWVRGWSVNNTEVFGLCQVRTPVIIIDQTVICQTLGSVL